MNATTQPAMKVAGISRHQRLARALGEGEEVVVRHDLNHPRQTKRVEVLTMNMEELGFISDDEGYASALLEGHAGGVWTAEVVARLENKGTVGLRIRVSSLIGHRTTRPGAHATGLRGLQEAGELSDGALAFPDTNPRPAAAVAAPLDVYATHGRLLGTLLDRTATRVRVNLPTGKVAAYPATVIDMTRLDTPTT